jgi:hypothetical protein
MATKHGSMRSKRTKAKRAKRQANGKAGRKTRRPSGARSASGPTIAKLQRALAAEFPNPRLTIELVPKTSWFSNVRSSVSDPEWDRLRRPAYSRGGYVCEVCGGRGADHPVECHEIWHYDDAARVQRLDGLIALCPSCHGVKHFGRANITGKGREALAHLAAANGWTPEQATKYVRLAFDLWKVRSRTKWRLDLSWLTREGVTVRTPSSSAR